MNKSMITLKVMDELDHESYEELSCSEVKALVEETAADILNKEYYLEYIIDGKLAIDCCDEKLCRCYWLKVSREGDTLRAATLVNIQI